MNLGFVRMCEQCYFERKWLYCTVFFLTGLQKHYDEEKASLKETYEKLTTSLKVCCFISFAAWLKNESICNEVVHNQRWLENGCSIQIGQYSVLPFVRPIKKYVFLWWREFRRYCKIFYCYQMLVERIWGETSPKMWTSAHLPFSLEWTPFCSFCFFCFVFWKCLPTPISTPNIHLDHLQ